MKYDIVVWEERGDEYASVCVCVCVCVCVSVCVSPRLLYEYIQMVSRGPENLKAVEQMIR